MTCNSKEANYLGFKLYLGYQQFMPIKDYLLSKHYVTEKEMQNVEKKYLTNFITRICNKDNDCMLILAHMLKTKKLNLMDNAQTAESFFNPYKQMV